MPRIAGMPVQLYGTYGLGRTGSAVPGNLLGRPRGGVFPPCWYGARLQRVWGRC
jgi:hypothetical protein